MPPTASSHSATALRVYGDRSGPAADRWPVPLAAAAILAMSLLGWAGLIQAVRVLF